MKVWERAQSSHAAKRHGFTTIELAVFIVVVGVLLGIIVAIQAGNADQQRNTERERDVAEIHAELESYYSQFNKYPTLTELNNTVWRATYMKGVDRQTFRDPSGTSYSLVAAPVKNSYAYHPTAANGSACNDMTITCLQYTLTTTLEGGSTYVENNLN